MDGGGKRRSKSVKMVDGIWYFFSLFPYLFAFLQINKIDIFISPTVKSTVT